ncbi:MAG TPA: LamB/YcsF family protein [Thermoanaerobacterales bacterium]|nr:LamB/YcsF family protein [Thermoanaerobacterales bacterium]
MGESFGVFNIGNDDEIVKYISSANVACGFHAGDAMVMSKTVRLLKENNVAIGAHPGLPDILGFGRRNMTLTFEEIKNYTIYQIGALKAFVESNNLKLQHVKAHGALYNMAAVNGIVANAIAEGIAAVDKNLICVGMYNTAMHKAAVKNSLKFASEVFVDRSLNPDGTLVSRNLPNAIIHDKDFASNRILKMIKEGAAETIDGSVIPVHVNTICVHGDTPSALELVKTIRQVLIANDITIGSISTSLEE